MKSIADFEVIENKLNTNENLKRLLDFKGGQFNKYIPFVRRFSFGSDNHGSNKEENE